MENKQEEENVPQKETESMTKKHAVDSTHVIYTLKTITIIPYYIHKLKPTKMRNQLILTN
jgi:hypothetical protein